MICLKLIRANKSQTTTNRVHILWDIWQVQLHKKQPVQFGLDDVISSAARIKQGLCAIWDIRQKLALNSNIAKSRLYTTPVSVAQSFWNFTQSTTVSLPRSVQKDWTIAK